MIILEGISCGEVESCSAFKIGMSNGSYIQRNVSVFSEFEFVCVVFLILFFNFQISVFGILGVVHKIQLVKWSFVNVIQARSSYCKYF